MMHGANRRNKRDGMINMAESESVVDTFFEQIFCAGSRVAGFQISLP